MEWKKIFVRYKICIILISIMFVMQGISFYYFLRHDRNTVVLSDVVVTDVENMSNGNIFVSFDNNKSYEIVSDYHRYRVGDHFSLVGLNFYPWVDSDLYYTDITLYSMVKTNINITYPFDTNIILGD